MKRSIYAKLSKPHLLAQKTNLSGVSLQPAEIRADTPRMAVSGAPIGYSRWSNGSSIFSRRRRM